MAVYRCFTEKKEGFDIEAKALERELRGFLGISGLGTVRILNRYDVEGISESDYMAAQKTVFSQPQTDEFYDGRPPSFGGGPRVLTIEALPGQFDQRADSCAQCLQLLRAQAEQGGGASAPPEQEAFPYLAVKTAKTYVFPGDIGDSDMDKIRGYLINKVETREARDEKPDTLAVAYPAPAPVGSIRGFIAADDEGLRAFLDDFSLAMDMADLRMLQEYFRDTEKRDPTVAELRVIDTYWSDHCRHTTFFTHITGVTIDDPEVKAAYGLYLDARREAYGEGADERPLTLMDLATMPSRVLRSRGLLTNIEISEEVNACSIHIDANVDGEAEDWLLMFKNETHNHPTEVEPFGGASTCVGGAIRDPMAGRASVYQAMRVTGAGDPRAAFADTIPGKHPQRKLTLTAALGNSSYGNQIGLPGGLVQELYHPGYIAKRMELGALVGAVKAGDVIRETPLPGDKVILLGGRTGRDGIGGATGSSKTQNAESLVTMASEVQKGNPGEERKILRMFLDPEVTKIIKKCNDFGAGGVSVAVGELADGLDIDLSLVRLKYAGLDGTEIAISESQERMAVVVAPENVDFFIAKAAGENLEAYAIAEVTESPRMVMRYDGRVIVDLAREFLSRNGATKYTSVHVPKLERPPAAGQGPAPAGRLKALLADLRFCSQRGLYEMFDGTVGASSILMKNGGRTQSTPVQAMAALLPVKYGNETTTCSVMAFGFDPYLSSISPFEGARAAVVTSVAKLVAAGCDPDVAYLTFQEYFESLRGEPARWGKPFSALLGAFEAQMGLGLAAIGGKDSMSGSFKDLDVPPTLVSFAIAPNEAEHVITPEFKAAGHEVVMFEAGADLGATKENWKTINSLIREKAILSAWAATEGGAAEGIFKMAAGNEIGFESAPDADPDALFAYAPGAIVAEVARPVPGAVTIGRTIAEPVIRLCGGETAGIAELKAAWEGTLDHIFPTKPDSRLSATCGQLSEDGANGKKDGCGGDKDEWIGGKPGGGACGLAGGEDFAKPRALVLAFPGTNSELDCARAVRRAGGAPRIAVARNLTPAMLEESIIEIAKAIKESQMLILPGGCSLGDEPDGGAKFLDIYMREPRIAEAVTGLIKSRDGLILGICNGFQALIRLGLVPFGEIIPTGADRPAFSANLIGRYQAGYVYTRVASVSSPWMGLCSVGDVHTVPISHGEGRLTAPEGLLDRLAANGQIATQYTDCGGAPSMDTIVNPNGSLMAIEGLFSPDGRVFGKMGHSERVGEYVAKNIYGHKRQPIFESGVLYFK